MGFLLPDSKIECSGWTDHDKIALQSGRLTINDKALYFKKRFQMIFFKPMDRVFLNSASHHKAVNSEDMSFFMIGTTALCCTVEALGGFILGHGGKGRNHEKFDAFIKSYLKSWNKKTSKTTCLKSWMWKNLRNPLAHNMTISDGGMAHLGKRRFREKNSGIIEIHVSILYRDLKKAFSKYILDFKKNKNKKLRKNFEICFDQAFIRS